MHICNSDLSSSGTHNDVKDPKLLSGKVLADHACMVGTRKPHLGNLIEVADLSFGVEHFYLTHDTRLVMTATRNDVAIFTAMELQITLNFVVLLECSLQSCTVHCASNVLYILTLGKIVLISTNTNNGHGTYVHIIFINISHHQRILQLAIPHDRNGSSSSHLEHFYIVDPFFNFRS